MSSVLDAPSLRFKPACLNISQVPAEGRVWKWRQAASPVQCIVLASLFFIAFPNHNFSAARGKAQDRSRLVKWVLAAAIFVALTAIPSQLLRSGYLIGLQKQWRYFLLEWCPASDWVLNSKCAAPTSDTHIAVSLYCRVYFFGAFKAVDCFFSPRSRQQKRRNSSGASRMSRKA